jgi:hypothetical protein
VSAAGGGPVKLGLASGALRLHRRLRLASPPLVPVELLVDNGGGAPVLRGTRLPAHGGCTGEFVSPLLRRRRVGAQRRGNHHGQIFRTGPRPEEEEEDFER